MTGPIQGIAAPEAQAPTAPVGEGQAPAPTPEPAKDPMGPKFAALAKKERAIYQRMKEMKALEEHLNARQKEYDGYGQLVKTFEEDPFQLLQKLGWDYDKLTQRHLNQGKMTAEDKADMLAKRIEEMQNQQLQRDEQAKKNTEEEKKRQEAELVEGFKAEIGDFVEANKAVYELIALSGTEAQDLVYDTIKEHFAVSKKIMSIDEAAKLVEGYLEEEIIKQASIEKIKSKLTPAQQAAEDKKNKGPSITLNNENTSSAASFLPAKTEADRMKRALAALAK